MTEPIKDDTPVVETTVEEKKKSRFNLKVIGAVVAGVAATVAGFVIRDKMKDGDSSNEDVVGTIVETFDPEVNQS